MGSQKIAFIKSLSPLDNRFPLNVLNNSKYDNHPLINKEAILKAIKQYDEKLHYSAGKFYFDISNINTNIEGRFLAANISEIPSVVVDETCSKDVLYKTLKNNDITNIALSTYASGLDKSIELIKTIKSEYKDITLYIGGVGAIYPHIQKLVDNRNICIGNGVNWLRKKFGLTNLRPEEFKIPLIFGNFPGFPLPVKTAFLISQIGCPLNCDFCITTNLLKHNPFSRFDDIIEYFDNLNTKSRKDIIVYVNEPNAFYPEKLWQRIFDYFCQNSKNYDNNILLAFQGSLNHINKFNLELIQQKSPLKFLIVSYGIESTLKGGYVKNRGNPEKIVNRFDALGIVTKQNYILGLPYHTPETIDLEIKNNLRFKANIYAVTNFKPIPQTPLYNQLKFQNLLYDIDLPPEFLYAYGYQAFKHRYLGGGFSILKYLFKAAIKTEEELIDFYGRLVDKLIDLFLITKSKRIKWVVKILMWLNNAHLNSFQAYMPTELTIIYRERIKVLKERYNNYLKWSYFKKK